MCHAPTLKTNTFQSLSCHDAFICFSIFFSTCPLFQISNLLSSPPPQCSQNLFLTFKMKTFSFNQERNGSLSGRVGTSTPKSSVMLESFKGDQEREKQGGSIWREGKLWLATLEKWVHTRTFRPLAWDAAAQPGSTFSGGTFRQGLNLSN